MAAAEKLTLPEFAAALDRIGGFEPRPLVAVGVSGGPDSMALMLLADRWARERGGTAWGLTVDHRLRPESAAEAATVGQWLAARAIPHAMLVWDGDKPATGIQEAARAERYRLLAEWCRERGCLHLLLAHHCDDQAETYLIRRRAKSGPDGLAGMPAVRELSDCRVVRPLLGVTKARLVALLTAENQPFIDDPSNRNPAFERARLRLMLAAAPLPVIPGSSPGRARERAGAIPSPRGRGEGAERSEAGEGPPPPRIEQEIAGHATTRIARERPLAALLARAVSLHPAGFAVLNPTVLAVAGDIGEAALGRVVAVLGGGAYPVRRERLRRLHRAFSEPAFRARTLGGCRFVPWRGRILALRETARAGPVLALAPGMAGLWDKRFFVDLPSTATGPLTVGPLGQVGIAALPRDIDTDKPLPRLLYPALPAISDKSGLLAVPHLGWRGATAGCLPRLVFRPVVSLFGAGFTVV